MAKVGFTPNIQRHVACESLTARGATAREVLDDAFRQNPKARDYVLDDQGALRKHMSVFIDGTQISDRVRLTDPVRADSEIWIMQSLSGG